MREHDLAFTFIGWTALLTGIWFLFEKSESVASQDTKLRVSRWLTQLELQGAGSRWPTSFIALFDSLFGKPLRSWPGFLRSCVASSSVVVIVGAMWAASHWNTVRLAREAYGPGTTFSIVSLFLLTTGLNLLPDYVSLLKSRYIIHRMIGVRSYGWTVVLFGLDLFITGCLALGAQIGFWLVLGTIAWATNQPLPNVSVLALATDVIRTWNMGVVFLTRPSYSGPIRLELGIPLAIWFSAAFFTSLWAGLFVLSGTAMRAVQALDVGVSAVRRLLDIEKKPITSLGWVAMFLVSVAYWLVAVIVRVRS
jgi:hypothetical protein